MKTVAVIQARMSSTRLPGKVLKEVMGRPLLSYMVERVKRAKNVDEIVVATSEHASDDSIEQFCLNNSIKVIRGPLEDVLGRYKMAADKTSADVVVRLTADCPLVDPKIVDQVIELRKMKSLDYAANTAPPEGTTFPDGMDIEVFTKQALHRAFEETKDPANREHVTFYFWKNPDLFKCERLDGKEDLSKYRLTVDYPEDFELVEKLLEQLYPKNSNFALNDILTYLNDNESVLKLNMHIFRNQGWKK